MVNFGFFKEFLGKRPELMDMIKKKTPRREDEETQRATALICLDSRNCWGDGRKMGGIDDGAGQMFHSTLRSMRLEPVINFCKTSF
jgi:hypothetical protein